MAKKAVCTYFLSKMALQRDTRRFIEDTVCSYNTTRKIANLFANKDVSPCSSCGHEPRNCSPRIGLNGFFSQPNSVSRLVSCERDIVEQLMFPMIFLLTMKKKTYLAWKSRNGLTENSESSFLTSLFGGYTIKQFLY